MQNKYHKICSICKARLDKVSKRNYSQVSKGELIDKLRLLNPNIEVNDYVCRNHSLQVQRLPNNEIKNTTESDTFLSRKNI